MNAQVLKQVALPAPAQWLTAEPSHEDLALFSQLASSIEKRTSPWREGNSNCQWRLSPTHNSRSEACSSRFTLAKDAGVYPFSLSMVDKVMWRSLRNGKLQFGVRADAVSRFSFSVAEPYEHKRLMVYYVDAGNHDGR